MVPITVAPYEPETTTSIDNAERVFVEIVARTPDSLGEGEKEALFMSFNSVVMEHFRAICILCRSQMAIGSAFALFRPLVDAIIRGEWLYLCATPEQMESFMKRDFNLGSLGFPAMAKAVDNKTGLEGYMARFNDFYREMSDYTHTGHDAVVHRLAKDGGIEPTYPERKIRRLVTQAARITLLHFVVVSRAMGDAASESRLCEVFGFLDDGSVEET